MPTRTLYRLALLLFVASPSQARQWVDDSGKFSLEAEFVRLEGDEAILEKSDGSTIRIDLKKLRLDDRCWVVDHTMGKRYADYVRTIAERKRQRRADVDGAISALKIGQEKLREIIRNPSPYVRRIQDGDPSAPWQFPPGRSGLPEWLGKRKVASREMTAMIRDWARQGLAAIPSAIEREQAQLATIDESTCHTTIVPCAPRAANTSGPQLLEEGSQAYYDALERWRSGPPADSCGLKLGVIGQFWNGATYRVVQVIGPSEIHVELLHAEFDPMRFVVRDLSAAGFAEQQPIELSGLFEVTGTETYATVIGGSATIFVVKPIRIPGLAY